MEISIEHYNKIAERLTELYKQGKRDAEKHGHWIENGYGNGEIVCSNCGEPCATFAMMKPRDRFCKWCGARMEGEEDEQRRSD